MTPNTHCRICDNKLVDFSTGITCSLTQEKPDFTGTCPDINLDNHQIDRIKEVAIELEKVKQTKWSAYFKFYSYLGASLAICFVGLYLSNVFFSKGHFTVKPLVLVGTGVLLLPVGFNAWINYRQNFQSSQRKKRDLDEILRLYEVSYVADVETIITDRHGNKECQVDIEFVKHYKKI